MLIRGSLVCALIVASLMLSTPVRAGDVTIIDNKQNATHDLKGGTAKVTGNHNNLTFKNAAKVEVSGNHNHISCPEGCGELMLIGNHDHVEAGPAKVIRVIGNHNTVTYKAGRKTPKISDIGTNNKISKI